MTDQLLRPTKKKNILAVPRIFLIGMPGCGKTYWSHILKSKLKLPAYDLDSLIEVMAEKSIPEIFSDEGELHFRRMETQTLNLFAQKKEFVLATGGGTPCHGQNMRWMNKTGVTIWIDEPIDTLVARLVVNKETRPLLKNKSDGDLAGFLEKQLEERRPFYEKATYTMDGRALCEHILIETIRQHA